MNLPAQTRQVPDAAGIAPCSALIAPSLSLASCVRAYVTRSTLGAALRPEQRCNCFPASPLCGINWLIAGESALIRRGDEALSEPLPAVSFLGPHTVPTISANPGPVQAFTLALIPEALQAMTGVDIALFVNRIAPLGAVFDTSWQDMALAVLQAPDDAARVQVIETFLEPRWRAIAHSNVPRADRYRHWVEAMALRAATSGVGKSLRQTERRIKQWAGLPLRELRRMVRAEEAFLKTRIVRASDSPDYAPNWAAIAAEDGFADQSHLCRETRRISGLSPAELKKAVTEDENYWVYRIWA